MEFKEAVTRNLRTSEGLFKFSGRASRAEMLWFWLFSMIWTYGSLFLGAIAIVGAKPGLYTMRILQHARILAQGTFRLTATP